MLSKPTLFLVTALALSGDILAASAAASPLSGSTALHQVKERHSRMLRRRAAGPALVGVSSTDNGTTANPCKRGQQEAEAKRKAAAYNIKFVGANGNVTVVSSEFAKGNSDSASSGTRQPLSGSPSVPGREALESTSSSSSWSSWSAESSSSSSWSSEAPAATPSINAGFKNNNQGSGSTMNVVTSWTGDDFLKWDYFHWDDPTHGSVDYVNLADAQAANLVNTVDGKFKMSVDTGSLVGGLRKSVRISSPTNWKKNQLVIADIAHMPDGCGTWPAFWSIGAKRSWPAGGEIDILEGVNGVAGNAYTLHTVAGCSRTTGQSGATSLALTEDCQYQPGCTFKDKQDNSFGPGFNKAGGGVYAAYYSDEGIKIWFWIAGEVPSSITAGSPDMSTFGTPKANFGSDKCDTDTFFDNEQMLIINTTLMGDWAGATFWQNGCTGTLADALSNGSKFNDAYWLINSVKIYGA